ncbi:helix-turn-helix domain-containing protein (plasmid) [Skermanella mucosa]|uniref:helix-turn-helix domain-containing protein n=1 Tax=Skermanella mucosa TaxID=1789672 RepID=UPI00192BB48D|nr:helix-turn-helix domain-containing protein [Skermanella mucosa]UEM25357.1 helix-turn-helix domain-containing protein [Skermanella mucosa]
MDAQYMGSRWGTVAASIMRRPGISVAAKAVYAALATYADRAGWIWVRQETIATDLGRSRAWVHAAISELESEGVVLHDRQFIEGRQRASRYRLLDGLARQAADAIKPVSKEPDHAVKPADTSHHDEIIISLSQDEGEQNRSSIQSEGKPAAPDVSTIPDGWLPTPADIAWARGRIPALDVSAFTETFVLSCQAKGYRYADPSAAWRRWLIEPKGALPLARSGPKPSSTETPIETSTDKDRRHDRDPRPHRGSDFPSRVPERLGGLAEQNAGRAAACLERILGRRAVAASAGAAA